jgi:hypothetical protein
VEQPAAWIYAPQDIPASASPTLHALPAGLSHVLAPQNCSPPPAATDPGTCGVPLGNECDVDTDCGPGHCLLATTMPWPAGYCVAQDTIGQPGCVPAQGAFAPTPWYSQVPPNVAGFWLRSCQSDADCARPEQSLLYSCDVGLQGCIPGIVVPLGLGGGVQVPPFCGGGMRPMGP